MSSTLLYLNPSVKLGNFVVHMRQNNTRHADSSMQCRTWRLTWRRTGFHLLQEVKSHIHILGQSGDGYTSRRQKLSGLSETRAGVLCQILQGSIFSRRQHQRINENHANKGTHPISGPIGRWLHTAWRQKSISETKTGSHKSRNIFLTFLEHDLFWHCNFCRSSIQIQVTIHALRTNQSSDRTMPSMDGTRFCRAHTCSCHSMLTAMLHGGR